MCESSKGRGKLKTNIFEYSVEINWHKCKVTKVVYIEVLLLHKLGLSLASEVLRLNLNFVKLSIAHAEFTLSDVLHK